MPRHEIVYPREMIETDEGKSLYAVWLRIRSDAVDLFVDYPRFFRWAMANGFRCGSRLRRHNPDAPYGPDNCSFNYKDLENQYLNPDLKRRANEWNRTVNRIRRFYKMRPFEVYDEEETGTRPA